MLTYIAAVATATTLTVRPIQNSDDFDQYHPKEVRWTSASDIDAPISISTPIYLSGTAPSYVLSAKEQAVFRRALLRSVRVIHSGTKLS